MSSPAMQRNAIHGVKASAAPAAESTQLPSTASGGATTPPVSDSEPLSPETPLPDYEEESSGDSSQRRRRRSINFVNNFQNVIFNIRTIEELYSCFQEPDPDYANDEDEDSHELSVSDFPSPPVLTAEELSAAVSEAYDIHCHNGVTMTSDDTISSSSKDTDPPLIKPKPLLNPCLESKERQALHRELLMNYKIGKDVLKKPELDKVLRERREKERKKEWDEQKSQKKGRTSLEIKLEERANLLKEGEEKQMKVITEEADAPELTRIHRKITNKSSGNSEQT